MRKKDRKFLDFINNPVFPCIGAKAAAKKEQITFINASSLTSDTDDVLILSKIYVTIHHDQPLCGRLW
ncbi:MAG: YqcI/YcgG family protein [Tatlockia sp.]|nr:YqcI/YcgG family protein [Tatlockia sp.]